MMTQIQLLCNLQLLENTYGKICYLRFYGEVAEVLKASVRTPVLTIGCELGKLLYER